jgi:nucleoporin NUP82
MPKVIGHTPPWLSKPSLGANIFAVDQDPTHESPKSPSRRASPKPDTPNYHGPRRLIAHRGTEVFVAVGKEIRWADLSMVKHDWDETNRSPMRKKDESEKKDTKKLYRTLNAYLSDDIRQLVISPSGSFLAICAERLIRIAILPDFSRIAQDLNSPLKLKTFQLGPTTHVNPESPLASVVWHPLAASTPDTDCLLTITTNAAVRVWEIERSNQWSFERPALAIDLRKLADGVSCDQDFQPSRFGKSRGFSVDDIDMEVASSCFAGHGADDEDAWASMTLWTAMKNGDVYALCPLLPSRWCPTSTTIPCLSTSAVSRMATIASEDADTDARRAADQQYEWVQEIDDDEPVEGTGSGQDLEIRYRPDNPSVIPRLQGPFSLDLDDEDIDMEVTDIMVFPPHLDEGDLYSGEDDYDSFDVPHPKGLPFTTILLATSDNRVHVALNAEGISGQWLPKKGRSTFSVPTSEPQELALVDTIKLEDNDSTQLPFVSFSGDPRHQYSAFVTGGSSVHNVSLEDWALRITEEIAGEGDVDSGLKTRLETSCKNKISVVERILSTKDDGILSTPVVLDDSDLGYSLLTASSSQVYGASFDQPHLRTSTSAQSPADFRRSRSLGMSLVRFEAEDIPAEAIPTRPIYTPPRILYQHPEQPIQQFLQKVQPKHRMIMKEQPMRLSPAMLQAMTLAHRAISRQTTELESAAAELFRRCDRLRKELGDQVKQMAELADRLHRVRSGGGGDYSSEKKEKKTPDERLQAAKERQVAMIKRYEALRKKVGKVGMTKKDLSAKETAWMAEIEAMNNNVGREVEENNATSGEGTVMERYHAVSPLTSRPIVSALRTY